MPYEISVHDNGVRYAVIKWSGPMTVSEGVDSGVQGIDRAARDNVDRILVDVSGVTNRLSLSDLYFMTDSHSQLGPPRPRAALLGTPGQEADLKFVETVGLNRGMRLKSFTSERDALEWLLA